MIMERLQGITLRTVIEGMRSRRGLDLVSTILDETLPLTVIEWEEWGNPVTDAEIYRVMKSYSPMVQTISRTRPPACSTN